MPQYPSGAHSKPYALPRRCSAEGSTRPLLQPQQILRGPLVRIMYGQSMPHVEWLSLLQLVAEVLTILVLGLKLHQRLRDEE